MRCQLYRMVLFGVVFFQFSLMAICQESFYEQLRIPFPGWAAQQIDDDLAPFEEDLSRKSLDALFAHKDFGLVRVRVVGGALSIEKSTGVLSHGAPDRVIPHLRALHALIPLPDIDFLFTAHDTLSGEMCAPIFGITKERGTKGILFPDWFALEGFEPARAQVYLGNYVYPWESKKNCLFFRGADSGVFDVSKWWEYPRAKLVALSLKYPKLIDARFYCSAGLHHKSMIKAAVKKGFMGKHVSMLDSSHFKYQMDIDGNCAATPRFPLLLHSNSVIFKNTTSSVLWFYLGVKPYTHFIPVAEDLSDLLDQLKWAKNHDGECREISENGRRFAWECLSQEAVYVYWYQLLKAYAEKQKLVYLAE